MFYNNFRKSSTREYNEKVDRVAGTKNGKPNKFKPVIETIREWVIDKTNDRKDYYAKKELNMQNEIDKALSKVRTLNDLINSQGLNPITTPQFQDNTETQTLTKTDLIDKVKNTYVDLLKAKREAKITQNMEDSAKHHNVSNSNNNKGSDGKSPSESGSNEPATSVAPENK